MDSLGEHLKRERELRGISLRHISDVTKIHMKYLEALEENHFEALPAEAFTKGFLRSYARCVGIDPDEVILIHKQYLDSLKGVGATPPPVTSESDSPPCEPYSPAPVQTPLSPPEKMPPVGSPKLLITLLSLFLVLAVAFFVFLSSRAKQGSEISTVPVAKEPEVSSPAPHPSGSEVNVNAPSQTEPARKAPKPEPMQKGPITPTAKQQAGPGPGGRSIGPETKVLTPAAGGPAPVEENQAPKTLSLTINAKEDTWIQATIDGSERREALIHAGSQVTWRAADKFILTIGNVRGTDLTLNGTEIQIPEGNQNVLRDFVISRDRTQ